MTQIMIDADRTHDTVILSIDPAVFKVYDKAAKERGFADTGAFIEALLADWPAILAPVPTPAVTETEHIDNPFGGGY